jgi:hypothetical protein
MDSEPILLRMEEQIAYNGFQDLVGEGGMSPGRVTHREKQSWLDERGYDRQSDRGCRRFFFRCFAALDGERQEYLGEKLEKDRPAKPVKGRRR